MLPTANKNVRQSIVLDDDACVLEPVQKPVIKTPIEECVDLFTENKCPSKMQAIRKNKQVLADEHKLKQQLHAVVREYKGDMEPNDLLCTIMQMIEDSVFLPQKSECSKHKPELCVEVMRNALKIDDTTIKHMIATNIYKLKRTNLFRRNKHRVRRVFFSLVEILRKGI